MICFKWGAFLLMPMSLAAVNSLTGPPEAASAPTASIGLQDLGQQSWVIPSSLDASLFIARTGAASVTESDSGVLSVAAEPFSGQQATSVITPLNAPYVCSAAATMPTQDRCSVNTGAPGVNPTGQCSVNQNSGLETCSTSGSGEDGGAHCSAGTPQGGSAFSADNYCSAKNAMASGMDCSVLTDTTSAPSLGAACSATGSTKTYSAAGREEIQTSCSVATNGSPGALKHLCSSFIELGQTEGSQCSAFTEDAFCSVKEGTADAGCTSITFEEETSSTTQGCSAFGTAPSANCSVIANPVAFGATTQYCSVPVEDSNTGQCTGQVPNPDGPPTQCQVFPPPSQMNAAIVDAELFGPERLARARSAGSVLLEVGR